MDIALKNEFLTVKASDAGAEITSMKDNKDMTEYIWTGDAQYWGKHAPILFPIIGRVKEDTYRIKSKAYKMGKHGFARDCRFETVEQREDMVLFRLVWNEKTLAVFPYKFELDVRYLLDGATMEVSYEVKNAGQDTMYFSIGGHPGFNCPLTGGANASPEPAFEEHYFEFDEKETAAVICINKDGLLKREAVPFLKDTDKIPLSHELFKDDALIFAGLKSNRIALRNTRNEKGVSLDFTGFPYLGLWTKPDKAPFVCIEPWYGLADYEDFDGDFSQKEGILRLDEGEIFDCKYSISILNAL